MGALPSATQTVRDGGLGLTDPASMMAFVYGVSSLGDPNEIGIYSSPSALRDARGYGPAVELALNMLSKGGAPIGFIGADPTIAAANGQVLPTWQTPGTRGTLTQSGAGPVITIAGDPKLGAALRIEIQTGGALGTATLRWSIDGGSSWEATAVATTGGTVVLSTADLVTGITATLPAGTYVSAETYDWTLTAGGGEIAVTGNATLDARVLIEIITAGALGVARFKYCLDSYDGDVVSERTYSEVLFVPSGGTFAIPGLGITLTFDATPAFVAGDIYTCDVQCAAWNSADLAEAFDELETASTRWRFIVAVPSSANGDAAAHAVLGAALQSQLESLAALDKYRRGIIASGYDDTAAAAVTAWQNTVANRVCVVHGRVKRTTASPFAGYAQPVTLAVDVLAARAAKSLLSTDLKRVKDGALDEVLKLFHDENATPSQLDDVKVSTLRTFNNKEGFYITQARLKSAAGSDFIAWPYGLIIDVACETVNRVLTEEIGSNNRTETVTINDVDYPGVLDERDAVTIETAVNTALAAVLTSPSNAEGFSGHVQQVLYRTSRTHNYLSTGVIQGSLGIRPLRSTEQVETDVGFATELPAV